MRLNDFSMDTIVQYIRSGRFFVPTADDLSAIVILNVLNEMSKGNKITPQSLEVIFRDSLPRAWMPVYDTLKARYPQPVSYESVVPRMPIPPFTSGQG